MTKKVEHLWAYHSSKHIAKCDFCGKTCKGSDWKNLREKSMTISIVGYCKL